MSGIKYLLMAEVIYVHRESLYRYGGADGIRDYGAIEAAIARPQISVGGSDAFPTKHLKAATYVDSFARNHPFVDGNKRVAYMSAGLFLSKNGISMAAPECEAYAFVLGIIGSGPTIQESAEWIRRHCSSAE
jgi:death on curing protein